MKAQKKKKIQDTEEQLADNLLPCDSAMREEISEECIKKVLRLINMGDDFLIIIIYFFKTPLTSS